MSTPTNGVLFDYEEALFSGFQTHDCPKLEAYNVLIYFNVTLMVLHWFYLVCAPSPVDGYF